MSNETGEHFFKVEANDGIRLYVNDEILIDSFTDVADGDVRSNFSVDSASMIQGQLVPIKI
jgi:hypothetical protein